MISLLKSDDVSDEFGIFALRFHPIQTNKLYTGGEAGIIDVYDVTTKEIIDSAIRKFLVTWELIPIQYKPNN